MQSVTLEDLVVMACQLPAGPDQVRFSVCLAAFEDRHIRHKIRKRLGPRAVTEQVSAAAPDLYMRSARHGVSGRFQENLSIVLNALARWRADQADRQ